MVIGTLEIDTLRQMYCTRIAVGGQQLQQTFYCCYIVEAVQHIKTYLESVDRSNLGVLFFRFYFKIKTQITKTTSNPIRPKME